MNTLALAGCVFGGLIGDPSSNRRGRRSDCRALIGVLIFGS